MANRISLRPSQVFDTFFDDFFSNTTGAINRAITSGVDIDMYDDSDFVYLDVKALGVDPSNVNIEVSEDKYVTISGEVSEDTKDEKKNYFMREIRKESFKRTLALPCSVDGEKSEAKADNGIIKVKFPKLPEVKPKKVSITPAS